LDNEKKIIALKFYFVITSNYFIAHDNTRTHTTHTYIFYIVL